MLIVSLAVFFGGLVLMLLGASTRMRSDPPIWGPPFVMVGLTGLWIGAAMLLFWFVGYFTH